MNKQTDVHFIQENLKSWCQYMGNNKKFYGVSAEQDRSGEQRSTFL